MVNQNPSTIMMQIVLSNNINVCKTSNNRHNTAQSIITLCC